MSALQRPGAAFLIALIMPASATWARVINVAADGTGEYPSIQAAIDASSGGDEVVLAQGVFTGAGNENLDFKGKAITVRSSNPADPQVVANTRMQGVPTYATRAHGFVFRTGEGRDSVLDGVQIETFYSSDEICNGQLFSSGGGVYILEASPTIRRCIFYRDRSDWWGGGIFSNGGNPLIADCTFIECIETVTQGVGGGAIFCEDSPGIEIRRCTFIDNQAYNGAAIYIRNTPTVISHCKIQGGYASNFGGAVRLFLNAQVTISDCLLTHNDASAGGGGISCYGTTLDLSGCTVAYNSAGSSGGGGIRCVSSSNVTAANLVLWGNTSSVGSQAAVQGSSTLAVSYADVQNSQAGISVSSGNTLNWGAGNIGQDPLFVAVDTGNWQNSNCHLQGTSPCRNTGNPAYAAGTGETDIDGQPRIVAGRVDMGSDEYTRAGDCNGDDKVNALDLQIMARSWNKTSSQMGYDPRADLNADKTVNVLDLQLMAANWNT